MSVDIYQEDGGWSCEIMFFRHGYIAHALTKRGAIWQAILLCLFGI